MKIRNERFSFLQVLLTVISVSCLLISNVVTTKQIQLPFGVVLTGGALVFPITYILSDVFSEVYGYRWSRMTCYISFAMNIFMVVIFRLLIISPHPAYWQNQAALELILGNTPRVLAASLSAYVVGDFLNDKVFQHMKGAKTDHKGFRLRAIVSSLAGELADSLVFMPIAFLGQIPIGTLVQMLITEVIIKTAYEVIILPITTIVVNKVDKYERGA